jgi:hypothetical protein
MQELLIECCCSPRLVTAESSGPHDRQVITIQEGVDEAELPAANIIVNFTKAGYDITPNSVLVTKLEQVKYISETIAIRKTELDSEGGS